jgi:hypothetical protein
MEEFTVLLQDGTGVNIVYRPYGTTVILLSFYYHTTIILLSYLSYHGPLPRFKLVERLQRLWRWQRVCS